MKKTILKSLLVGAVALTALTTWAENKVYVVDFEVKPGKTVWVNLVLENESDYIKQWQADLVASEGLTIQSAALPKDMTESAYQYVEDDEVYDGSISYSANYPEEGTFRVMGIKMKGTPLLKGHKYLAKLKVKAATSFTGNGHIDVKYFKAAADDPTNDCVLNNPETPYKVYIPDQVTEISLANLVATGEENKVYKITDAIHNVKHLDNQEFVFVSNGTDWMRVVVNDAEETYYDYFETEDFAAGSLVGTINNVDGNQTLTIYKAPTSGTTAVNAPIEDWNLAQSDVNSPQWHFRPKVNQVINLQGYYNAEESKLVAYADGGGQFSTVATDWAAKADAARLRTKDGMAVQLKETIVQVKEPWTNGAKVASDDVHAYENYKVQLTGFVADDVLTGVESLNSDKAVVSVQYVNVAGQISSTPFDGVNMVVTRYADGSTKTTKVIK